MRAITLKGDRIEADRPIQCVIEGGKMNWESLLYAPVGQLLWKRKQNLGVRETSKPAIGATICCSGMRMSRSGRVK